MGVQRHLLIFVLSLFVLIILVHTAQDHYKNKYAYDVKEKIIEVLEVSFKEQKPVGLQDIGGVNWEKVCFISYELNGIDVSSGLDIPVRYLKIPKEKFSQVANDYYNEFKSSRYGLVFFSVEEEIFVSIPLEDAERIPPLECHDARNLVLLNRVEPEGRLLTLSQK